MRRVRSVAIGLADEIVPVVAGLEGHNEDLLHTAVEPLATRLATAGDRDDVPLSVSAREIPQREEAPGEVGLLRRCDALIVFEGDNMRDVGERRGRCQGDRKRKTGEQLQA